jgi:hypothetical protein
MPRRTFRRSGRTSFKKAVCKRRSPDHRGGKFGGIRWFRIARMGSSAYPQELNQAIGGEFAIGARDIQMGHRAHGARAKRRDQHTLLPGAGDDRRRVGRPLFHVKDHDVALHRREIEADTAQSGEPFRQWRDPRRAVPC